MGKSVRRRTIAQINALPRLLPSWERCNPLLVSYTKTSKVNRGSFSYRFRHFLAFGSSKRRNNIGHTFSDYLFLLLHVPSVRGQFCASRERSLFALRWSKRTFHRNAHNIGCASISQHGNNGLPAKNFLRFASNSRTLPRRHNSRIAFCYVRFLLFIPSKKGLCRILLPPPKSFPGDGL